MALRSSNGISPGAVCRNSDGSEGTVKTPGTVIQGYAQQAFGSGIAQLINPQDIDASLVSIMSAAINQLIQEVFGAGALRRIATVEHQTAGDHQCAAYSAANNSSAMTSANAVADAALARATDYSSAWTTIGAAANSAAASVASLKNNAACTSQSSVADSDVNATARADATGIERCLDHAGTRESSEAGGSARCLSRTHDRYAGACDADSASLC